MQRNTAVWRRPRVFINSQQPQAPLVSSCAENPQNRSEPKANHFGVATRAQVLTLKEFAGLKPEAISEITGVKRSEIFNILKRAKERGYEKEHLLQDRFFEDATRPSRPPVVTKTAVDEVKKVISESRKTRSLTVVDIARRVRAATSSEISPSSIWRALRFSGYWKVKPTMKPGLTSVQKVERLKWYLAHKDWTLEDWKQVLWSDETSIIYGLRRGGEKV